MYILLKPHLVLDFNSLIVRVLFDNLAIYSRDRKLIFVISRVNY